MVDTPLTAGIEKVTVNLVFILAQRFPRRPSFSVPKTHFSIFTKKNAHAKELGVRCADLMLIPIMTKPMEGGYWMHRKCEFVTWGGYQV